MKWIELNNINKDAPLKGKCLCYTRKKIVYKQYESLEALGELLNDKELLEIHLFDSCREYRALSSTSRRFPDGVIEHVISDDLYSNNSDRTEDLQYGKYDVKALVQKTSDIEDMPGYITIRNYYKYNDAGSLNIVDYRLFTEEE